MLKIILIFNFVRRGFRECFDSKNNLTIESCGDFLIFALPVVIFFVLFLILKKTH